MVRLSRRTILLAGSAWAFAGGGACDVGTQTTARPSLSIPPELRADAAGSIKLDAQAGTMRFLGDRETATYGVNGPYLGPALRLRRGETVTVQVTNSVPENITMHWHGLIIPGAADGGPHQVIAPGKSWRTQLSINQPAATLWFHPHYYPSTAQVVIKGLAGLLIVDDEEAGRLPLPSRWGVDDIPLIIQDRRFTPDGQFFDRMNAIAVTNGYVGDIALVNGARYPEARTARGWIRLRILTMLSRRTAACSQARWSSKSCKSSPVSVLRCSSTDAMGAPSTSSRCRSRRESCGCRRSTVRCHWSRSGPTARMARGGFPHRLPSCQPCPGGFRR